MRPDHFPESGRERRVLVRVFVLAGAALFIFLIGHFVVHGPLHQGEAVYPRAGRTLDAENKVVPPSRFPAP